MYIGDNVNKFEENVCVACTFKITLICNTCQNSPTQTQKTYRLQFENANSEILHWRKADISFMYHSTLA